MSAVEQTAARREQLARLDKESPRAATLGQDRKRNGVVSALGRLRGNPALATGLTIFIVFAALSLLAPVIAPHSPTLQNPAQRLAKPGHGYLLGGVAFGRDVFSRLLYAGRISLLIAVCAASITLVIGVAVGTVAGYYGSWVDRALMRFTDMIDTLPSFFLLILVGATFGPSVRLLIIMIDLTSWSTNARILRGVMFSLRDRDYVVAARVVGARDARIVIRHLVPQLAALIVTSATFRVSGAIMTEAGLSFLGIGINPPTASWGNMIADGEKYLRTQWWQAGIPGLTIFVVVLGFNLLGEGLRDELNPRTRRRG